jgi:hypothetical protein
VKSLNNNCEKRKRKTVLQFDGEKVLKAILLLAISKIRGGGGTMSVISPMDIPYGQICSSAPIR